MTNTLGWRRLIGWLSLIAAGLVVGGYMTVPEFRDFVMGLLGVVA